MNLVETFKLLRKKEKKAGSLLNKALSLKRYQQKRLTLDILESSDAFYLPAVNSTARIKWGRIFAREVFSFFEMSDEQIHPDKTVFLVTLADKALVTTASPQKINIRRIKRRLGSGLKGLNYIGMIEPGYYNNAFDCDGNNIKQIVSWHGHFIVWGIDREELRKHIKQINSTLEAIMPNFDAADQKQIEYGQFGYKLWYIVKSPCKEYSAGKRSQPDKKTGAARYKHNKRDIRPGARVKLFHLMRPLYLDQLAMAGGQGKPVLHRIKTAALTDYRQRNGWAERRP